MGLVKAIAELHQELEKHGRKEKALGFVPTIINTKCDYCKIKVLQRPHFYVLLKLFV